MKSRKKSKEDLLKETEELRGRISELEESAVKLRATEKALRDSDARFRLFYEDVPLGCQSLDDNGLFLEVNNAWLDTLGYTREEVIGKSFSDFLAPGHQDHFKTNFPKFKAAGEIHGVEFEMIRKDGSRIAVTFDGKISRDEAGRFKRTHCILHDITEKRQLLEALALSNTEWEQTFDAVPDLMMILDRQHRIVQANKAMADALGVPKQKVAGLTCYEIVHGEKNPPSSCPHAKLLIDGKRHSAVIFDESLGGTFEISVSPLHNDQGEVVGSVHIARDITERQKAAEALRESEERLALALDGAELGLWDWDLTKGKGIWNARIFKMIGLSPGEIEIDVKTWKSMVHPQDWPQVSRALNDHLRGDFPLFDVEHRARAKSGDWKWVLSRGKVVARDQDGRPERMLGISQDVSLKKAAEEALIRSEASYRAVFDSIDDAIFVHDMATGDILDVNRKMCEMYGFTPEEARRLSVQHLSSGEPPFSQVDAMKWIRLAAQQGPQRFEWRSKDRNGRLFWVEVNLTRTVIGGEDRLLAVVRDITERKQAEEEKERLQAQLIHAQKMEAIGTLAGGIAHDFNNMLTVILGYSELLLLDRKEDDQAAADLKKIIQTARNGADLVQRLLMFSRKAEAEQRPLDLSGQIGQMRNLLARTLPKKIEIHLMLADDLGLVTADPAQMDQVVMNLAINANDAMPAGGRLTIQTRNVAADEAFCRQYPAIKPGKHVLLSVADTGRGMDQGTIDRIFDPFFTTKGWGSRKGTGLGLAIAHGIVEEHGGCIECFSEVGKGTIFNIYLPAMETSAGTGAVTDKDELPGGSETILLVDDEEFVRDLGERIFRKAGYTVRTAENGKKALELYRKDRENIHLVVLDLIMPEMDGNECLDEMLEIDPKAKIIVSTGHSIETSPERPDKMRAKAFVNKPYDVGQLLRAVRDVLDET